MRTSRNYSESSSHPLVEIQLFIIITKIERECRCSKWNVHRGGEKCKELAGVTRHANHSYGLTVSADPLLRLSSTSNVLNHSESSIRISIHFTMTDSPADRGALVPYISLRVFVNGLPMADGTLAADGKPDPYVYTSLRQ